MICERPGRAFRGRQYHNGGDENDQVNITRTSDALAVLDFSPRRIITEEMDMSDMDNMDRPGRSKDEKKQADLDDPNLPSFVLNT